MDCYDAVLVLLQLGLVDGVITEDSDAFLFGAQAVYKNIFNDKKFVEIYLAEDAKRELGLSREDLIALAFFLGSDYTEGVNGIGVVNAMEIIQAFSMKIESGGPLDGLKKFKEWLQGYDFAAELLKDLDDRMLKRKKASVLVEANESDQLTISEQRLVPKPIA
jgi:DNA excision repair protein ERCC-5